MRNEERVRCGKRDGLGNSSLSFVFMLHRLAVAHDHRFSIARMCANSPILPVSWTLDLEETWEIRKQGRLCLYYLFRGVELVFI